MSDHADAHSLTLPDGRPAPVYVSLAGTGRRGAVVYLHGIQSHPGWFEGSAAALAGAGYDVYRVTRRGSGASTATRGHAASAHQLLVDVEAACEYAADRSHAASEGVHLVGVSWGGKLAAAYAVWGLRRAAVASVTMIAPGLVPRVDLPWGLKVLVGVSLLACPRRLFDVPLSDVELFTDNPARRQYLTDDPMRLHRATASFLYASRRLDAMLRRAPRRPRQPATLLLASRDRIIDNARTRKLAESVFPDLVVRNLPGCHTLEFEPDPSEFYAALVSAVSGRG
jgi:alpha-beta hydrolase superfamily lysophospholipase